MAIKDKMCGGKTKMVEKRVILGQFSAGVDDFEKILKSKPKNKKEFKLFCDIARLVLKKEVKIDKKEITRKIKARYDKEVKRK